MIEIKDGIIGYDSPLFNIQNLKLNKGKVFALIGKNGMGKSTFLNSLVGHIPLLSGSMAINGSNVQQWSIKKFAQEIAYVSSRFEESEYLSVLDYVSFGKFPNSNWLGQIDSQQLKEVEEIMEDLGLHTLAKKFTSEISDGERQLCALARALAQNTETLILDEPSAFLDYANRKRMIQVLKNLASSKNMCILLSTHDLDLAFDEQLNFIALNGLNLQEVEILSRADFMKYFN